MTLDERRELCQCSTATLDGYPAVISAAREPFAIVTTLSGAQYGHKWSWGAVARIVAKGGEFHS